MHNATTKQRHAALRRKLGIFLGGAPRWVRERRQRALRLKERIEAALSFAVTPSRAFAAREHAVEASASGPPLAAPFASQAAPTEPALPAFVPPPPPAGPALPASVPAAAPERGAAADAPTVIERRSPREPSRPAARGHDGPPRTTRVLAGAAASCAAVLAVAFLAELRDGRRTAALAPPAPGASEDAARSAAAPAPSPAPSPAPEHPASAIPSEPAAGAVAVVRGDTLWHLAARHLGDPRRWPGLFEANRGLVRDPDLIYPGQELRLPAR